MANENYPRLSEEPSNGTKPLAESKRALKFRDFEDVLLFVGGWGRYQFRLLLWCLPFTLFLSYAAYSPILYLYVPEDHRCRPEPRLARLGLEAERVSRLTSPSDQDSPTGLAQCRQYVIHEVSDETLRDPSFTPSNLTSDCRNGIEYNFTGFFHSASTDMDWVCGDAWKSAFTQSLFSLGGIVGTLFFGYTADRLGRLWTVLASNGVLCVAGLATPLARGMPAFAALRFLTGLSHVTFFATYLLLALEFVSIERRALVGNLSLAVAITAGGCVQPWLIRWLGDWKPFHHVLFLQTLIVVFAPCCLHESVRWLASKGRMEECLQVLESISKTNGRHFPSDAEEAFRDMVKQGAKTQQKGKKASWTQLFTTPGLRKNFIIMIIAWMLIASTFDGHIRNIANLRYSIYVTFTVSALLELPADLLAVWGLNLLGRRWSAALSQLLAAAATLACLALEAGAPARTATALLARFFITYAMNTGTQITYEVVPTVLRGQGNALANVFAQAAQFFAPYVVHSAAAHEDYPFLILGVGSLLGAAVSLLLPETADVDLPDTVEEAKTFGRGQSFWHVPCIHKGQRPNKTDNGKDRDPMI